jgi:cobalt-zinc-cadmium efflux system membrane fusion protein
MRRSALALALLLSATGCHSKHSPGDDHDHPEPASDAQEAHDDHDAPSAGDAHEGEAPAEAEEEGVVHLSASAIKRSNIRVAPVRTGALQGVVELPAEVQLNPDRVAHITPIVDGQLISVDVTVGDEVLAEQKLGALRSIALGRARAALARARALREVARKNMKRQKTLRGEGISSERSLLAASLAFQEADTERTVARSHLRVFGLKGGDGPDMPLLSPIAGRVLARHATQGENVAPSDTLFVVADLSNVWIIGRVYEQQIAQVKPGMEAILTLNAYPSRTWRGTVDFMAAALDETTRTLPIRVALDNTDGVLRPGLFGTLRLSSPASKGAVVLVPETAVQTMDNRTVVFVPGHAPGEFERRPVTLGRASHGQVEILKGLSPTSAVVVSGGFVLKSELMRGELGHGHAH